MPSSHKFILLLIIFILRKHCIIVFIDLEVYFFNQYAYIFQFWIPDKKKRSKYAMYQLRRISAFQYLLSRNVILFFVSVVVSGSPVFTLIAFFTIVLKPFLVFGQIVPLSTRTSILICVCIRIYAYTRALLSVPSIFYLVLVLSEDNLICPITNLFGIVS